MVSKQIAIVLALLMISGCSLLQQPPREVEIITKPIKIDIVQPVLPRSFSPWTALATLGSLASSRPSLVILNESADAALRAGSFHNFIALLIASKPERALTTCLSPFLSLLTGF